MLLGQGGHRQRRADACDADVQRLRRAALGGPDAARVVVLDVDDRRDRRDVLEPELRPAAARRPRHRRPSTRTSTLLTADPDKPNLPRAYREIYPPGSTFKIVTTAVALDTGIATPDTRVPDARRAPAAADEHDAEELRRRDVRRHARARASSQSCNTTFGQLGLELGDQFPPGMDGLRRRRRRAAARHRARRGRSTGPGRRDLRPGQAAASRSPGSARATWPPPRCRWRWSPRRVANGGVILRPARRRARSATTTARRSRRSTPRSGRRR